MAEMAGCGRQLVVLTIYAQWRVVFVADTVTINILCSLIKSKKS